MEDNMNDIKVLAETIYKRRSVRKFAKGNIDFLNDASIDLIKHFDLKPLDSDIMVKITVAKENTNYFLCFHSEAKPHNLENIGFIGQQLDLHLQTLGYGTCWRGMLKTKKGVDGLNQYIRMAVGCVENPKIRTYPDDFKRKDVSEIVINTTEPDKLIEAVRIAPSAVNNQPWLVEKTGNKYNFYLRPATGLFSGLYKQMRNIDMGIGMAHLYVQATAHNMKVTFDFDGQDIENNKFVASLTVQK
jgi:nitroreductase